MTASCAMPEPRRPTEPTATARETAQPKASALADTLATLDRTVTEESREGLDSYLNRSSTVPVESTRTKRARAGAAPPVLMHPGLLDDGTRGATERYAVGRALGHGAGGRVYVVHDRDLDRDVAAKFIAGSPVSEAGSGLVREARTLARLEHPNILPVYDVDHDADGHLCFTMRLVRGRSLGEDLRAHADKGVDDERGIDQTVRVFLKVCDALRYAHHRGVLHLDIKPDNIMVGEYGEVLLLDWGSSASTDEDSPKPRRHLVGTPAYMSPEQARGEPADVRSDVYCLGATLFHCLLRRHPTWAKSSEEFWDKKNRGAIDPPSREEKAAVPFRLLAIVLKALEPAAQDRYPTAAELAEDLERCQAGRAMSWRPFQSLGDLTLSSLAREWTAFTAAGWKAPRQESPRGSSAWRVERGRIVGSNRGGFDNLTFGRQIPGDMRVEWTVTARTKAENLNCFIGGRTREEAYTFHVCAQAIPGYCELTKGGTLHVLDSRTLDTPLVSMQPYRFRMEKEGGRVRLFVDGRTLFDYEDPDPLVGPSHQTFGFENSSGNTQEIGDITIQYRPLPQELSPLSVPDHLLHEKLFDRALRYYQSIVSAYPDLDIARTARYKIGKCYRGLGDPDRALGALETFERQCPRHPVLPLAVYERARILYDRGKDRQAERIYRRLARAYPGHSVIGTLMGDITRDVAALYPTNDTDALRKGTAIVRRWAKVLGVSLRHNGYFRAGAVTLSHSGQHRAVLRLFPELHEECAAALLALGRPKQVLERYPDLHAHRARALLDLGRPGDVLEQCPEQRESCARALLDLGRFPEILVNYPEQRYRCAQALLHLGHLERVAARYPDQKWVVYLAYLHMNRLSDVPGLTGNDRAILRRVYDRQGDRRRMKALFGHEPGWRARDLLDRRRFADVLRLCPLDRSACRRALVSLGRLAEAQSRYGDLDVEILRGLGRYEEALRSVRNDRRAVATMLGALGRHEQILKRFADLRPECAGALICMGEYHRVLTEYPDVRNACGRALIRSGRPGLALRRFGENVYVRLEALEALGRNSEIARDYPDFGRERATALLSVGKPELVLKEYPRSHGAIATAHLMLGHTRRVLSRYGTDPTMWYPTMCARALEGLHGLRRGDARQWRLAHDDIRSRPIDYGRWDADGWFVPLFLPPLVEVLALGAAPNALRAACARIRRRHRLHFGQIPWHLASYVRGDIDRNRFLDQPARLRARELLPLARAIVADRDTGPAAARPHYEAWLARVESHGPPIPVMRAFARMRIAAADIGA